MLGPKNYALTLLRATGPMRALGAVVAANDADAIHETKKAVGHRYRGGELSPHDKVLIRAPDGGRSRGRQSRTFWIGDCLT